jgi:hypothetical protein
VQFDLQPQRMDELWERVHARHGEWLASRNAGSLTQHQQR